MDVSPLMEGSRYEFRSASGKTAENPHSEAIDDEIGECAGEVQ